MDDRRPGETEIHWHPPYTYTHGEQFVESLRSNPLVKVEKLGQSDDGRNPWLLRISDDSPRAKKPALMYARCHAYESAGTDALFAKAVADLQPALLDYTVGSSTMAINRRRLNEQRHFAEMLPEPRKAIDPDVPILRVSAPDGKVRAVIFGYACHPSTLEDYRISPDYVGYARDWIAAIYPGCVPIFFQGCGGDIKTRYIDGAGKFKFPENLLTPDAFTAELGHELGRAVVAALSIPPGPVPADRPKAAADALKTPVPLGGIVEEYDAPDKKQPDKVSRRKLCGVWRVGDVYFVGAQCEIGSQIGLRMKREMVGGRVWTCGYTHHGIGYFLDAASYSEGGYEIDCSDVGPGADDVLVATVIHQVRALKAGRTGQGLCPDPPKKQ